MRCVAGLFATESLRPSQRPHPHRRNAWAREPGSVRPSRSPTCGIATAATGSAVRIEPVYGWAVSAFHARVRSLSMPVAGTRAMVDRFHAELVSESVIGVHGTRTCDQAVPTSTGMLPAHNGRVLVAVLTSAATTAITGIARIAATSRPTSMAARGSRIALTNSDI